MRLPIYEKLIVRRDTSRSQLLSQLELIQKESRPFYIFFEDLDYSNAQEVAIDIDNYFSSLNHCCQFPYPIYIVSSEKVYVSHISVVKNTNELPKHFNRPDLPITPADQALIKKIDINVEATINTEVNKKVEKIKNLASESKILFKLARVGKYYQFLYKNLKKANEYER